MSGAGYKYLVETVNQIRVFYYLYLTDKNNLEIDTITDYLK
jgi:hypothetical protein